MREAEAEPQDSNPDVCATPTSFPRFSVLPVERVEKVVNRLGEIFSALFHAEVRNYCGENKEHQHTLEKAYGIPLHYFVPFPTKGSAENHQQHERKCKERSKEPILGIEY
jgi:hypothetical protein